MLHRQSASQLFPPPKLSGAFRRRGREKDAGKKTARRPVRDPQARQSRPGTTSFENLAEASFPFSISLIGARQRLRSRYIRSCVAHTCFVYAARTDGTETEQTALPRRRHVAATAATHTDLRRALRQTSVTWCPRLSLATIVSDSVFLEACRAVMLLLAAVRSLFPRHRVR